MNSLLSLLQNHYQPQMDQSLRLGTEPDLPDILYKNLSVGKAQEAMDWIVQQQWEAQVEYVYESIRHLCSPALTLLKHLVENGHGNVLCGINPTALSPVNRVIVAHALQVGRNTSKINDALAQNAIFVYLKDGDVDLMAHNFTIWMNDHLVADFVVNNLLSRNAPLDGVLNEVGEWIFSLNRKSMWGPEFEPINQWITTLLSNEAFSGVVAEVAAIYEHIAQKDAANGAFFEGKFRQMLSTCSCECAQKYMETATASSADLLLPLFPESFQYQLAQFSVVQNSPNAQQIRERKNIAEAIMIGEALVGIERAPHTKKI